MFIRSSFSKVSTESFISLRFLKIEVIMVLNQEKLISVFP